MSVPRKTAIVTGASQGIGAGIVKGFVERGFNVVANLTFALQADFRLGRIIFGLSATRISEKGLKIAW
jgi:NAD(P)-dependent dehydrogenase (short-subunit alcohol dehydrogenase family)